MEEEKPIRRRTRITQKKEDHVYQANTDGQGERFDTDEQKKAAKKAAPAIFAVDPATLVPPRKNRGRPSKAYLEAMEEYNRQLSLFESLKEEHLGGDESNEPNGEESATQPEEQTLQPELTATPAEETSAPMAEATVPATPDAAIPTTDAPAPEIGGSSAPAATPAEPAAKGTNTLSEKPLPTPAEAAPAEAAQQAAPAQEAMLVEAPDFIVLTNLPTIEEERKKLSATALAPTKPQEPEAQIEYRGLERANTGFKLRAAAMAAPTADTVCVEVCGVLELEKDSSGFLRSADYNYLPSPDDVMLSAQQVRQFALHTGDTVEGTARLPRGSEKAYVMVQIEKVNGLEARKVRDRAPFESLTPLFPDEKFKLCTGVGDSMSCRIVDLISPIGKGQRALIVAQPKTGKTLLMKDVANAIARNHPDSHLIMLLIDERPEEVTDMARTVNAEVIASTFDEPASQHVRIANIVLEKAKRMVECGHDVVIFLDSITRLARAYNTVAPTSGKILSGGVEANALQKPKRFFGAARNIEGGGSLTIIATALIDTGSKMDEVIFEEFKGTGNMELQLDRALANKRIFPAVNLTASSTRRDELLLDEMTTGRMWVLRNYIADMNPIEAMKFLKQRLEVTKNNEEFIISINS